MVTWSLGFTERDPESQEGRWFKASCRSPRVPAPGWFVSLSLGDKQDGVSGCILVAVVEVNSGLLGAE